MTCARHIPRVAATALAVVLLAGCGTDEPSPPASSDPTPSTSDRTALPSGAASAAPSVSPTGWERIGDAPFARLEMAVAAHQGRIWLAGGLSPFGEALTDVEVFDPSTGEWTDGPSLPAAVHHAALVSDGQRLLLMGGYIGSDFNRPTDIVLGLADGADTWTEGPPLPDARAAGAAAWDGERVLYAGGVGDGVRAEVWALSGDAWQPLGTMAAPREHFAAASDLEGATWLLGGRAGGLTSNMATVELVTGSEITMLDQLPTPRGGVAAFFDPGVGACLTGGEAPDRAYTTVECVGTDGAITTLPELLEPHHGHGAAVVDGLAYVLLGGPEPTLSAASTVEVLALGGGAD